MGRPRRNTNPLRGALLGLVARAPRSGYDIVKCFDRTLAHVWSVHHTQVYPELTGMEAQGLIVAGPPGSRGRREYSITAQGRKELRRWLYSEPIDRSFSRNEPMLRAFFLGFLPPDDAKAFLAAERDLHRETLALFDEDAASDGPEAPGGWTGAIVLEGGRRYERMMIRWLTWAIDEVDRLAPIHGWQAGATEGDVQKSRRRSYGMP